MATMDYENENGRYDGMLVLFPVLDRPIHRETIISFGWSKHPC